MAERQIQRDHAAHAVAEDDRRVEALALDERGGVAGHGGRGVVGVAHPLGVAVPALVERVDVVAIGQVQADEIPRVRRLIRPVQQDDGRRAGVAPLQQVQPQVIDDDVAGDVAHAARMRDAQVGGAALQAAELVERGHVERAGVGGEFVQVHGSPRPPQRRWAAPGSHAREDIRRRRAGRAGAVAGPTGGFTGQPGRWLTSYLVGRILGVFIPAAERMPSRHSRVSGQVRDITGAI